jgi:hypothetical protein
MQAVTLHPRGAGRTAARIPVLRCHQLNKEPISPMDFLDELLESRKLRLSQSPLCAYMADRKVDPCQRLSFIPAMIFFTMGFKDILAALRDNSDKSALQACVHRHCDEDAFHWQWYLEDLETIEHGRRLLRLPAAQAFTDVWSPANHATREAVYHAIHLAKTWGTPFYRMVLIEALEATFACFNQPMYRLVDELGMAERLHYFGQTHQHAEASHAKDQHAPLPPSYVPTEDERTTAGFLVNQVFDTFKRMFDCWHAARLGSQAMRPAA